MTRDSWVLVVCLIGIVAYASFSAGYTVGADDAVLAASTPHKKMTCAGEPV